MRSDEFWQWFNIEAAPRLAWRTNTFRKMFEHLDAIDRPVHILETGCAFDPENWDGNGCSTILFDRYAHAHKGSTVRSVDINLEHVEAARQWVNGTTIISCSDSIAYLKAGASDIGKVDLLYLDSFDFDFADPVPAAQHQLNELMAAMPILTAETLVVCDDAPANTDDFIKLRVLGKGAFVAEYACSIGADLMFSEVQSGWTNMTGKLPRDLRDIVMKARAHVEAKNLVAADFLYRQILDLTNQMKKPLGSAARVSRGEACAFFAQKAIANSKVGAAIDWYLEALRYDPKATDYRLDLATKCYLRADLYELAVMEATRATQLEPESVKAWCVLGSLEHESNHPEKSVAAFEKAIELAPDDPEPMLHRTTIAMDVADYVTVKELCAKLIPGPMAADAKHILGMLAYREDRHEDAVGIFDEAIAEGALDPSTVRWHKSHALESIGRYKEANEARSYRRTAKLRPHLRMPFNRFPADIFPVWEDEPPPARLHIHAESGAGDNLCLVRYLPLLAARGYEVSYEAQREMSDLINFSMPEIDVVPMAIDYPGVYGIKPFDYHLPIGEIQRTFGTDIDTVPWDGPYIKADPEIVRKYASPHRRVGLCWSSGIRLSETWLKEYGLRKSMHFNTLAPLIEAIEVPVNLQIGPEREQHRGRIEDVLPEKPTWMETAALVAGLDLVITVDTSVAHLAGAMGKPVWLMMHRGGSWHWMVERPGAPWNTSSPWYPSVRIFRQKSPHVWDEVIEAVRAELGRFLVRGDAA